MLTLAVTNDAAERSRSAAGREADRPMHRVVRRQVVIRPPSPGSFHRRAIARPALLPCDRCRQSPTPRASQGTPAAVGIPSEFPTDAQDRRSQGSTRSVRSGGCPSQVIAGLTVHEDDHSCGWTPNHRFACSIASSTDACHVSPQ